MSMNDRKAIIGPSFQLLSNWCSMRCAGCGIRVSPPPDSDVVSLEESHVANATRNLQLIKETLTEMGFDYGMVEQSGGEPSHHPQIVEAVGRVFPECVHKIITNGLPSQSIYDYLRSRGSQVQLVVSIDHHQVEFNRIRLGNLQRGELDKAVRVHDRILENLALFVNSGIPVVVSTIITKWTIEKYLEFIEWLEHKFPNQIQDGMLVPIPVSLVSFGNSNVGRINPLADQVTAFEEAVEASSLLTVVRAREWLFNQLIGHYRNKQRFFQFGESLEEIAEKPSRYPCEIYRHMISFNFQDEEILRSSEDALFQGFACGVKVLGNVGHALPELVKQRIAVVKDRPSNLQDDQKYYRIDQVREYIETKEAVTNEKERIRMGVAEGYFNELRRGMCMLDDFDGVWWPLNLYLQGVVGEAVLGEYWCLFRNERFVEKLRQVRQVQGVAHKGTAGL